MISQINNQVRAQIAYKALFLALTASHCVIRNMGNFKYICLAQKKIVTKMYKSLHNKKVIVTRP